MQKRDGVVVVLSKFYVHSVPVLDMAPDIIWFQSWSWSGTGPKLVLVLGPGPALNRIKCRIKNLCLLICILRVSHFFSIKFKLQC